MYFFSGVPHTSAGAMPASCATLRNVILGLEGDPLGHAGPDCPKLSPGSPTGRGLATIQKIVGHRRDELGPRAPIHLGLAGIASRESGCDQCPAEPRGSAAQDFLPSEIVRAQPRIRLYEIVHRPASYTPPR